MEYPNTAVRKLVAVFLLLVFLSYSCVAEGDSLFVRGTYQGTGEGFGGTVKVTLTVNENKILSAKIDGLEETLGQQFFQQYEEELIGRPDADIDMIAGATVSYQAIMAAANEALLLAKVSTREGQQAIDESVQEAVDKTLELFQGILDNH